MNDIEKYIKRIVDQTDCSREEREDLAEELTVHLEILTENNIKNGMNEQEAISEAIRIFGSEQTIGDELQQAMFPYRKELLVIISLSLITLSFAAFSVYLYNEKEALNAELLISVLIGLSLLASTSSRVFTTKRKLAINISLVLSLLVTGMNSLILSYSDVFLGPFLSWCNYALLLAIIVMLYVTSMHSSSLNKPVSSLRKLTHFINITAGLLLLAASLFFIWGLAFAGGLTIEIVPFIFIPLLIWLILYIIQIRFFEKIGKMVYIIFVLYGMLAAAVVLFYLSLLFM